MAESKEAVYSRETAELAQRRSGYVEIDSGQSLSSPYRLYLAGNVAIAVPEIDSADLTFQVQYEPSGDWFELYTDVGAAYEVEAGTGGIAFVAHELGGFYAVKVRTGTADTPVVQNADRKIGVLAWDNN